MLWLKIKRSHVCAVQSWCDVPNEEQKHFRLCDRSRSRVLVDVSGTNKHRINIPVWWNLEGFFFFEVQFWILYQVIIQTTHSPQVTVDPRSSGLSFAFFLFLIQSKPPVFYSRKFKNLTLTQMSGLGGKASRWMEKKLLCSNNSSRVWKLKFYHWNRDDGYW